MGDDFRLFAVADVHVGNHRRFGGQLRGSMNDRCRAILAVFGEAVSRAIAGGATSFVVAGDLIDYATPEPPIVRALQRALAPLRRAKVPTYLLAGNHEQTSLTPDDNALAPLAPYATVVEGPMLGRLSPSAPEGSLVLVPFRPGVAEQWLPAVLEDILSEEGAAAGRNLPHDRRRVLVLHMGIRDAETAPWLRDAQDAYGAQAVGELAARFGFSTVVAGNWHDHRSWAVGKTAVVQVGALVPTGWDNPGLVGYGSLVSVGPDGWAREELPGPRFVKLGLGESLSIPSELIPQTFVSATVAPEQVDAVRAGLSALPLAGLEVLADQTVAAVEARNAGAHARRSETFDEALAAFVEHMPLPEGVNRSAVARRAKGYVK